MILTQKSQFSHHSALATCARPCSCSMQCRLPQRQTLRFSACANCTHQVKTLLLPHHDVPHLGCCAKSLCTFGPVSAAGSLVTSLSCFSSVCVQSLHSLDLSLLNQFASGQSPHFLRKFVAGGVSIALEKSATAVRPLACGDPIRRLVVKCFCVAGKEEISAAFAGRNFGVGCKGGVEVVAHSLRNTLKEYANSDMGLLKIDFRNAFNEVNRDHFVRPPKCFLQCPTGHSGVTVRKLCFCMTTNLSLSPAAEYSRATLGPLTSAVVLTAW